MEEVPNSSITMSNENSDKQIYKIKQFYQATYNKSLAYEYQLEIIKKEGDVNFRLPYSKVLEERSSRLIGSTLLHLVVDSISNEKIFLDLLDQGADFTIKNNEGSDVLHSAIDEIYTDHFKNILKNPYIDKLLDLHINSGSLENPADPNGKTYFHAACLTNNNQAVEYFLKAGVNVNQAIHLSSRLLPGYTGLHIAAQHCNVELAELLLIHGADISIEDSQKRTPLAIVLKKNISEINWSSRDPNFDSREKIIELIVKYFPDTSQSAGINPLHLVSTIRDSSKLQNYLETNEVDINCPVRMNSSFWVGYTPLHFAMLMNLENAQLLIAKGADLMAKDAESSTPFDICMQKHGIHLILKDSIWKDIILSDGKTKLIDFAKSMHELKKFKSFLKVDVGNINAQIPSDSSLWPGYTLLHVILDFCRKNDNQLYNSLIKECLIRGAAINIINCDGDTPLDIAMQSLHFQREAVVSLFFKHHLITENFIGKNGISYLHIACAVGNTSVVDTLLSKISDVNQATTSSYPMRYKCIAAGSTPLHIAVGIGNVAIVKMLLKKGADVQAKDCNNMTPIHYILMSSGSKEMTTALLDNVVEDQVSDGGLSYLHVASLANNAKTVKKLLNVGVDIETAVTYESGENNEDPMQYLSSYSGCTALHFAIEHKSFDVVQLLMKREVNIFKSYKLRNYNSDIVFPLYHALNMSSKCKEVRHDFVSRFLRDDLVQERSLREIGLTKLHVHCSQIDINAVKQCLDAGANVNAQLHLDSPIWAGFTPLHVLLNVIYEDRYKKKQRSQKNADLLLKILLDNGADVAMPNAEGYTALNIAHRQLHDFRIDYCNPVTIRQPRLEILLNYLKNFATNHVNNEGLSHLHIACEVNHLDSIKLFLKQNIDVNQVTDYFSRKYPGYNLLHMAMNNLSERRLNIHNELIQVIGLLLDHNVDVNAEDSAGRTPLHKAAKSQPPLRTDLLDLFIRRGADVQARDMKGRTPFEILLTSKTATAEEIRLFLKYGLSANSINHISKKGYIAMALSKDSAGTVNTSKFEAIFESIDVTKMDTDGRTVIHNVVSAFAGSIDENDYADVIEKLKSLGCDVDHQDNLGETALHIATRFRNCDAISGLFKTGADVDIVDFSGKSAFDLLFNPSTAVKGARTDEVKARASFVLHIYRLQRCKLNVSQVNRSAFEKALQDYTDKDSLIELGKRLDVEIQRTKSAKIESSSRVLYDFLSEDGAVAAFPRIPQWERQAIMQFFEDTHRYKLHNEFVETAGLLKLQYRKALARLSLIEPAKVALRSLIEFSLPDLCSEAILKLLTNLELKSLIDSASK